MSEAVKEMIYTVPLGKSWAVPRNRRAEKAVTVLRAFVKRHAKPSSIVIEAAVNEAIWKRGMESPPRRIRVKLSKDGEGKVTVGLAEGG